MTGLIEAQIHALVPGDNIDEETLVAILDAVSDGNSGVLACLRTVGQRVLFAHRGRKVHYRGLLEFSNLCARNCLYCGIRAANTRVERFTLGMDEIEEVAKWATENGYGSLTLQSGERNDQDFVDYVEEAIDRIKAASTTEAQPEGLGITLCVGEQNEAALRRFLAAGAHRYLLRMETTNPALYAAIHPEADGNFEERLENLRLLKRLGFQVGTGVMIGIPGQTTADLARDLLFFKSEGVHMIGMGPYIPSAEAPMGEKSESSTLLTDRTRFELGLAMISLARILLPKANIAATTALQALHPFGRERGLDHGANILMPLVTPGRVRAQYQLYDGKPCIEDETDECRDCLAARVAQTKRELGCYEWGDSLIPVEGFHHV